MCQSHASLIIAGCQFLANRLGVSPIFGVDHHTHINPPSANPSSQQATAGSVDGSSEALLLRVTSLNVGSERD
jgi:hypothetical protein